MGADSKVTRLECGDGAETASEEGDGRPDSWHELFEPNHNLKRKVGYGGLDESRLQAGERQIENFAAEFSGRIAGEIDDLEADIEAAREAGELGGEALERFYDKVFELKGQSGTGGWLLLTWIMDSLKTYLDGRARLDARRLAVPAAHIDAARGVLAHDLSGDGGEVGQALIADLSRVNEKYK